MNIRKPSKLVRLFAGPHHPIREDSPELIFMRALCSGDREKLLGLFGETKLFGNALPAVDLPYGRYEGKDGIARMAEEFLSVFHAESAGVTPVVQTRANGRSVLEMALDLVIDGEIEQVPMFVVGELRTRTTLDEVRIYCHHTYVPGLQAYRKPIFSSAHLEMGDPNLLTGSVREYYEALHHVPAVDVDRILGSMNPDCIFGGYEAYNPDAVDDHGDLRKSFTNMASYIPRCVGMRYETITDDGVTCVIEWQHIVSRAGQEERSRIALAGISAYERGENGLLSGIRISDYAGYEKTIDWSKTPVSEEEAKSVNYVETFPAGCGQNAQS